MKTLLMLFVLAPAAALAWNGDLARPQALAKELAQAQAAHDAQKVSALLTEAAQVPWPALPSDVEALLATESGKLDPAARRAWALDRALPMLAGELAVPTDVLGSVLGEVRQAVGKQPRPDLANLEQARRSYAKRELERARTAYAQVTQGSALWPDALREEAWTLLLLGKPSDALGATVSLGAPYFPVEDHAEARLLKATVLLDHCRFAEAREVVQPLADAAFAPVDPQAAQALVASLQTTPQDPVWRRAWETPLVARVRVVLAQAKADDQAKAQRQALSQLAARLLSEAAQAENEALRELKQRALSVRYEALKGERSLREEGRQLGKPERATPAQLDDDEVAWTFDGTFWRDELGTYRYAPGDACPKNQER